MKETLLFPNKMISVHDLLLVTRVSAIRTEREERTASPPSLGKARHLSINFVFCFFIDHEHILNVNNQNGAYTVYGIKFLFCTVEAIDFHSSSKCFKWFRSFQSRYITHLELRRRMLGTAQLPDPARCSFGSGFL